MKNLISVIVSLVITGSVFAQEWTQVNNPDPSNRSLYSVYFTATDTGYAVGADGAYLRWYGTNWQVQPYPANYTGDLKKVLFVTNNIGYIAGGSILKTVDGGDSWSKYTTNTSMYDLDFWNENNGVAVGADGIILKTTDGGENWTEVNSPTNSRLSSVDFSDDGTNGIIVGSSGTILQSTDGGENWIQINSPIASSLYSLNLSSDGQTGIATGYNGTILKTTDGGENWTEVNSPINSSLSSVNISSDENNGLAVGENGAILNTNNAGDDWESMDNGFTNWLREAFILPDYSAWVVGNNGFIAYNPAIPLSIELVGNQIPTKFQLAQNYPNPFNPITTIEYSLPVSGMVTVTIFNLLGQEITQLVNEWHNAGTFRITWNASDLPSGTYFYQIQTEPHSTSSGSRQFTQTRKMVLMK